MALRYQGAEEQRDLAGSSDPSFNGRATESLTMRVRVRAWLPAAGSHGDDDDDELTDNSVEDDIRDQDWMWDEKLDFSGVIRVRISKHPGGLSRRCVLREGGTRREVLELAMGKEETLHCDDIGMSALSDSQLEDAADFLDQCRRKAGNAGKVLIIPPPSRPTEALSIALFALSLPSKSSLWSSSTPSHLSQLSYPPGILELIQENHGFPLIQLALWHIHDLPLGIKLGEQDGLKSEWRGALSFDGIQRLESLSASKFASVACV
ncbi:hypothetical protein AGABI2DRAFT_117530 [Agaricus bisporus var. bisporus H97]|uniref:hypothetical protein n=1 Tax=Agaricus bisporus var. bisporus (strain H97 / ATCC MYA-4626 / FGSC 10389) TaxID=936046 RepID=UPI00029F611A|nr:hypothetical protein AGABI2DRAFT_117530 [Agaricus bisporus var. bisporus H97]EKV48727.1 hypothetical protein AGABI2DRAFT_117530 [Agaricus bisporus var. bisporus H97]